MPKRLWLTALLLFALAACDPYDPGEPLFPSPAPTRAAAPATAARATAPAPPATALAGIPTPAPTATAEAGLTATVFNGGNLRAVPSLQGQVLDQVHANERVALLARSPDGAWYRITNARDITGWVSRTLLTVAPEVVSQVPQASADGQLPAFPPDWAVYNADAVRIALPPGWQPLPLTREELQEEADERRADAPALARGIQQMIDSGQYLRLRFLAVDPAAQASVTLIVAPGDPLHPPQQVLQAVIDQLPQIVPGIQIVSSDTGLRIGGLEAARVEYDADSPPAHTVQFYIADGVNIEIVTVSGPASAALVATADQIGNAVRVGQRPAPTQGSAGTRAVTNGGNLRSEPQLQANNVLGQVCPGDEVALIEARQSGAVLWYRVRLVAAAEPCHPQRAEAGTEGWLSGALLGGAPTPTPAPSPTIAD